MQETEKYKLGYFEQGDTADADIERGRWLTLDRQILGLFQVLGNGIIDGWNLVSNDPAAMEIAVAPGAGNVDYVAVESENEVALELTASSRNFIWAALEADSYYNGTVSFFATTEDPDDETLLALGYVDTNAEGDTEAIAEINTDARKQLNFRDSLLQLIKQHRHLGGADSPSKINLQTDVQGFLQPGNMADLDASLILRGVIDKNRLPQIDHIEDLVDQGILTHAQLDTFVQLLHNVGSRLMGEVSTVNLLKLILALKHAYPGIDDFLVNELAFIPGISPNDIADMEHTTAEVDLRPSSEGGTHTIKGTPAQSTVTHTKRWDEADEFSEATLSDTVLFGDSLALETLEGLISVEDFENVSDWKTTVTDLSDISAVFTGDPTKKTDGTQSGKLDVGKDATETVLMLSKTFDAQDWSKYTRLVFQIYTESAEHGDIYFFFSDAVAGSQGSNRVVLGRNQPTTDIDTGNPGWREIVVDLSGFTRTNVTAVAFYTSTDAGWQTDIPFALNVDNMNLTTGNYFRTNGTARFRYGNGFPFLFERVRWTASVPTGTSLRVRTRVSNDESLLDSATWSVYLTESGSQIVLPSPGSLYKYIEIEVLFESESPYANSPFLRELMLDTVSDADAFSFDFNTEDDWKSGGLHNIDATRVPGSITVKYVADLGTHIYGTDGSVRQLNSDFTSRLVVYGSAAPKSFKQMLSGEAPGFGALRAVEYGLDGTFLVADTDNDRVLEVGRDGEILWGLMGAYPTEPTNPYDDVADEPETVPPTTTAATTTTAEQTETAQRTLEAAGCYYNPDKSRLSIMFNGTLSNIYAPGNLDLSKIALKAGTRRVYLGEDNADPVLFGVDAGHAGVTATKEFFPSSSIMLVTLAEADAVVVNNVSQSSSPYLMMVSPVPNALLASSSCRFEFSVVNAVFGEDYGIRLQVDGGTPVDLLDVPEITVSGFSDGAHSLEAVLIDQNGLPLSEAEAKVQTIFMVATAPSSAPQVAALSPVDHQVFPGTSVSISYAIYNPAAGGKLKYQVDGAALVEHTGGSPLTLSGLTAGAHEVTLVMTDSFGVPLPDIFASVTIELVCVSRNDVSFSIALMEDAVKDSNGVGNKAGVVEVQITPVEVANVRAPIDVRAVVSDRNIGDATEFDVVVAKVASPSYLNYYSKGGEGFLDGHSVVQYNHSGAVVMTTNDALIARNREEADEWLGSVEKGAGDEFLIGDAVNKRAIVSVVDRNTKTSQVVWEYQTDRIVSDFARVPTDMGEIVVDENGLSSASVYLRRDASLTWINRTSSNIRVLSGAVTPESFAADPDLSIYGSVFDSGVIPPGEGYTFRFINYGTVPFFVWPAIEPGSVYVTNNPVSPLDRFVVVENDPVGSSYNSRVAVIDAWGNVQWTFGETFVRKIKDARPVSEDEVVVST